MAKLKDLVKDIQSGKTEATYKNNNADKIVNSAMGKRLKKHKKVKMMDKEQK